MLTHDLVQPSDRTDPYWCLVLHGLGDSKNGWKPVVPMLALPRMGYVLANAPMDYHGGYSWFDIHEDHRVDHDQVRASRAALDTLIDHLLKSLAIPSTRLFVLGFSQGGLMTLDVGLRSRHAFAGLIGISGFMAMLEEFPANLSANGKSQPILLTHGIYDGVIPISAVRRQKEQLKSLGIALEWKEYDKDHTLDPTDELEDIRAWLTAHMRTQRGG